MNPPRAASAPRRQAGGRQFQALYLSAPEAGGGRWEISSRPSEGAPREIFPVNPARLYLILTLVFVFVFVFVFGSLTLVFRL